MEFHRNDPYKTRRADHKQTFTILMEFFRLLLGCTLSPINSNLKLFASNRTKKQKTRKRECK